MFPFRHVLPAALLAPWLLAGAPAPGTAWTFDAEQPGALTAEGGVHFGQPGPRRPDYPRFSQTNRAIRLDGRGARLEIPDPGTDSPFDFRQGDALTLEAWVRLTELGRGENVYLIGKGRTDPRAANPNNQNWALRLRETRGAACPSFLFASTGGTWHRWTAGQGLRADGRWHHVAVSYVFGQPDSLRAYLDGEEVSGDWDMAGATTAPPIVDDAPVWIGRASCRERV